MAEEIPKWNIVELTFTSDRRYENPYTDVDLSVTFISPSGDERAAWGFWDGDATWRVRFAPSVEGRWEWYSESSDPDDGGLHGRAGAFQVSAYDGANPIYAHGFLKVSDNRRGFVHRDGTPFFWLGDTVWSMSSGVTTGEWEEYLSFRRAQGFNVVQVNSLPQHDSSVSDYRRPFSVDRGGWDLARPDGAYFWYLDRLVAMTTDAGMFTAMVVLWFDYVPGTNLWWNLERKAIFTPELAARYGRYLAARYAAFGTIWIVTGDSDFETPESMAVYDAAANAIRAANPYVSLMTAHLNGEISTPSALNEREWLDFHMFQSGHGADSRGRALTYAGADRACRPVRPVFNAEPMYDGAHHVYTEGHIASRATVRRVYWSSILGGGNAGLTYGAHGLWSWARPPLSPTWRDVLKLESADDAVRLKRFLAALPWWELGPSQHLLAEGAGESTVVACTRVQEEIVAYVLQPHEVALTIREGLRYVGEWFNPATGRRRPARLSEVNGQLKVDRPPWQGDAVLLLRRA
jgi:hypothetical protein